MIYKINLLCNVKLNVLWKPEHASFNFSKFYTSNIRFINDIMTYCYTY